MLWRRMSWSVRRDRSLLVASASPQRSPCAASKGASVCSSSSGSSVLLLCRLPPFSGALCFAEARPCVSPPSQVGRRVAVCRVYHTNGRRFCSARAERRQGGLRAVVLCGGGATWAGRSCLACVAPHSLYYLCSTPACDQAPLLYLIYFLSCFTQLRNGHPERWISAPISGSLGVLRVRGLPKWRQRRSGSLRFPGYPNFVILAETGRFFR